MNGFQRNASGVIIPFLIFVNLCAAIGADAIYQGKPASYWLEEFHSPTNDSVAAFKAMGSNAVPFLIKILETKPAKLAEIADEVRAKYSIGREIPPIVDKALPSAYRTETRREHAAFLIGQIGPNAEAAIPTLLRVFTDRTESWRVTTEARSALLSMGEKGAVLVPTYLSWLKNTNVEVQIEGATFLGSVGPKASTAVPELLQAVDRDNLQLRWSAAWALWRIDRHTNVALRVFGAGLEYTNAVAGEGLQGYYRMGAFGRFREMGAAARPVAQKIAVALWDKDEQVREAAVRTLKEIEPTLLESRLQEMNQQTAANIARLIETIQTGDYPKRYRAIEALALFGSDARHAVPVLMQALDAPVTVRAMAHIAQHNLWRVIADSLGEIGPDARAAVPNLVELIHKSKQYAGMSYCPALGKIGTDARLAVPALQNLLQDENPRFRLAAADALTRIVPQECSNVVVVLTNLQHDPEIATVWVVDKNGLARRSDKKDFQNPESVFLRLSAAVALWRLGLEKEPPVDSLIELAAKEPSMGGELWAIKLLGEIGPAAKPALPTLRAVLVRKSTLYSRAAAIAIRHIDCEEFEKLGLPGMLALP